MGWKGFCLDPSEALRDTIWINECPANGSPGFVRPFLAVVME
jgi:hypothetical protein